MFTKKHLIVALFKDLIVAALVAESGDNRIGKSTKYKVPSYPNQWSAKNLANVLGDVYKKFKAKKIRILLGDNLNYTFNLNIPGDLTGKEEREYVFEKVRELVPENLSETDWDYREIKSKLKHANQTKKVIVFVPVKGLYDMLQMALDNSSFEVEAIEPELIAGLRNSNPLVGLAMKKDIKGKDQEVLNLSDFSKHKE